MTDEYGVDQVQHAYELAVEAVMETTSCDELDASAAVERIVELIFLMIKFNGDFDATRKH
jgi:hypothetical protein